MFKRILSYLAGLIILAFGSAFAVTSDLGVSPMGALPYVGSLISQSDFLSVGVLSIIKFLIFIALQIIILRKNFRPFDLIQIVFALIFGVIFDLAIWALAGLEFPLGYFGRMGMLVVSILLIAIGLVLLISAKIIPLPPEALCIAITKRWERAKFHIVKMSLDSTLVLLALALSLIALDGVYGVREGTIISALAIGRIIPFVRKAMQPITKRIVNSDD